MPLTIYEDFISLEEEEELIKAIDDHKWSDNLSRQTQHYGYKYNYRSKSLSETTPFPPFLEELLKKIKNLNSTYIPNDSSFNQCIINNYEIGQRISAHIDSTILFDNTIIALSLLSEARMIFKKFNKLKYVVLKPRSLLIMSDGFRYNWSHELEPVKDRRVSITLRSLIE